MKPKNSAHNYQSKVYISTKCRQENQCCPKEQLIQNNIFSSVDTIPTQHTEKNSRHAEKKGPNENEILENDDTKSNCEPN